MKLSSGSFTGETYKKLTDGRKIRYGFMIEENNEIVFSSGARWDDEGLAVREMEKELTKRAGKNESTSC